ncbi:MAG: GNAT family N-acetyltransferase [Erysipelotrichaceae bacterium]|nr:GNAT family N-acetyltransferase [Erysipelotrichaceae bacterium]
MRYKEKEFILNDGSRITLRSAEKEDAEMVLDFMIKTADQTDFLLSTSDYFRKISVEEEEAWISRHIESDSCILIVIKDGKMIASSQIDFMTAREKERHRSSVGITVEKEYWNKGIGTIIFKEFIDIARNHQGTEQIELGVIITNERARHLYEKMGFRETGVIPRALKLPDGTYLDEILMTRFLDEE